MDLHILDDQLRRTTIVDLYESFIWTERFNQVGDFVLVMASTAANRSLFPPGTQFVILASRRVMVVEKVQDTLDNAGHKTLTFTGYSKERVLDHRIAAPSTAGLLSNAKWIITDQPADIARLLYHTVCVDGSISVRDVLTGVTEANALFPADTIPEPTETITYEVEPKSLYLALKDFCEIFNLGFRLVRSDTPQLYFDIYTGVDRTTQQSAYEAVVFSPGLDNLHNASELASVTPYRNVVYVISPVGYEEVLDETDDQATSFDRKIIVLKADDIDDADPAVASARMIQRGREELSRNRKISAFDGEIGQYGAYVYGQHYNLGDLVELQNSSGGVSIMRVTEQIFVSDKEGDRSYPTLTLEQYLTPGSWATWPYSQTWSETNSTEWDDL